MSNKREKRFYHPNIRAIGEGICVSKGPFGRPITVPSTMAAATMNPILESLQAINETRLEIRSQTASSPANYFILVPTLRCNIACKYCQVSRVAETARGFDWDVKVQAQALDFICATDAYEITVEFQGGEPLLRLDVLRAVTEGLGARGKKAKIVVCTNLQKVHAEAWEFLKESEALISTSFDGTWADHDLYRTQGAENLAEFRGNLTKAMEVLGPDRVSLTTTFNPHTAPAPHEVFGDMRELGVRMMFIRPVNYLGFARKSFRETRDDTPWDDYYLTFLNALIDHNRGQEMALSEYYFTYVLRRILDPRRGEHVDLRNPAPLGRDYFVIGERGDVFPSDEARMLYRTGQIDLRIGHVATGLDHQKIAQLNEHADNRSDPECAKCVYQAVCGRDLVDDISRYGTIDLPRHRTRHCQRHMSIFDFILKKLATASATDLSTMAAMAGLSSLDVSAYRANYNV
ncbi:His-Xaa-Ser system radical SAM maturase HxsB [Pseudooceanicola nitratireducens]